MAEPNISDGCSNPMLSEELIDDVQKIKGDAIGSTLYSERWVLKHLIALAQDSPLELSEEFESELCILWDMTLEHDVVNFLMKHEFLEIATKVIRSTTNVRLIEIIVGVIGNMCCVESVRGELSRRESTLETLLALFETPDSPILVQLVRLLHSTAWDLVHNPDFGPHWLEKELDNTRLSTNISFILMSSTSEELIYSVLEFLNTLCSLNINDKDFSQYFSTPEIVKGLIESWQQLFVNWSPDEDFPSKQLSKAATYWTAILCSFAGQDKGRQVLCEFGVQLGDIFSKISSRSVDCIDVVLVSTVTLMEALVRVYFNEATLKQYLLILHNLYQCLGDSIVSDDDNLDATLQESIESYCANISAVIEPHVLQTALAQCNENHVLLFWKIVNDRLVEEDSTGERTI